ncbi:MAG: pyruvate, phosphate dikinase [Armatimonadota bacterium]|nr:pyruvate, phosphate dikinase [Armatimonadota bacterium]MDR7485464.1 pyruvate, phosphate dikinase [Armatimonadota bacterium]MDR7533009.1 pyruvate, phosphate dikinase [Armatimonadota bacterium]MDR7536819.1 pyruvate, phosphate dikinase [Armatimonadota bacterium]
MTTTAEAPRTQFRWTLLFEEGDASMRDLLGGKGAGLAEMSRIGLPVPPGFTITTRACVEYMRAGRRFPDGLMDEVGERLRAVETKTGKRFGDPANPLLLSVRSGAKFSMPGMMDTVLNLGLNDRTLEGLIRLTGNPRFGWDAYRRLVQMFGKIVLDIPGDRFEHLIRQAKRRKGVTEDTALDADDLKALVAAFRALIKKERGVEFPQDPHEQLRMAIQAVFDSWWGKRAVDYRTFHGIAHDLGTAANVQTMVFGNMGPDSATGVAFTRNPATGEKQVYGEYLVNAQGEDVVAGIRTPKPISELAHDLPDVYQEFLRICQLLERHYRDVQDVEFTIERGRLWMLQTRTGKRTAQAAVKIAVDMADEGLISREEAVLRVEPGQIDQLLHPRFDPKAKEAAQRDGRFLARGLNASPGAAVGLAAFDAALAEAWGRAGKPVILVRPETNPDDVHGMLRARGILTSRGGATSHAAVVARGLGVPCVAGCEAIDVDPERRRLSVNGITVREGEYLSIDGTTGEVFAGQVAVTEPTLEEQRELMILLGWADGFRRLGVWANADYPRDARRARAFGAEGIGLTRTEHMFFETDRLPIVRQMILHAAEAQAAYDRVRAAEQALVQQPDDPRARTALAEARRAVRASPAVRAYEGALRKLERLQRRDFEGLFEAMDGLPVIIRLIDPPLHEFLPSHDELLEEVAGLRARVETLQVLRRRGRPRKGQLSLAALRARLAEKEAELRLVRAMREANPMLGLRGIRLGLTYPAITVMQVRAIIEAACRATKRGITALPEIMIPLTSHVNELRETHRELEAAARAVMERQGVTVPYKFGTMIEIPRACLVAGEIAQIAEFFSFGTNDLTQTIFGISRDDAEGKFLLRYVERGILPENPFQTLDRAGVGEAMRIAVERGRAVRPDLEVGICGEHGGDPASIAFCHELGLNYVSCSPFRVPVARLAAAQVALRETTQVGRDV